MTVDAAPDGALAAERPIADHAADPTRDRDALLRVAAVASAGAGQHEVFGTVVSEASSLNAPKWRNK